LPPGRWPGRKAGPTKTFRWKTANLAFVPADSGQFRLTNRLTGKTYVVRQSSFEVLIEPGGKAVRITGADFALCKTSWPSPGLPRISYDQARDLEGLGVDAEYALARDSWFIIRDFNVGLFKLDAVESPIKRAERLILEKNWFFREVPA
jgi:hypothetical protein